MKSYLYRVYWVRPYYVLLPLLLLCILTVAVSLLYLEDASLKLPLARLQAAQPPISAVDLPFDHVAIDTKQRSFGRPVVRRPFEGDSKERSYTGKGPSSRRKVKDAGEEALNLVRDGVKVGGGGVAAGNRSFLLGDAAAGGGSVGAGGDMIQKWPDRKKPKQGDMELKFKAAVQAGEVKVLNSLEIVAYNLNHPLSPNHPQKESEKLGIHFKDGAIAMPPYLLAQINQSDPSLQQQQPQRPRYIIYRCTKDITCCGWGDRQHGILSAYIIAMVTKRRFGVDMSSPCPLTTLFHYRLVDWTVNASMLAGLTSRHIYSVNDKLFRQAMHIIDFDAVYTEDVVYLTTNYDYFYALKTNPHYAAIFRKVLHGKPRPIVFANLWQNIFKLNKRVRRRIDKATKLAHPTPNHKLICSHVRFGKNPTIPNDSEVRNTMQTIKPLWNFLAHFRDPSKYRIFVPSDSDLVRAKVLDMFPGQAVDIKGEIMHIDKNHQVDDACLGFEKVLADQYFLSTCDVLVLTYSVFGKSAAYMRRSNKDLYYMENSTIKPLQLFKEKV